jgi:hypothetical protein
MGKISKMRLISSWKKKAKKRENGKNPSITTWPKKVVENTEIDRWTRDTDGVCHRNARGEKRLCKWISPVKKQKKGKQHGN